MRLLRWLLRVDERHIMHMEQIQALKVTDGDAIKPLSLPAIQPLRAVKVDRVERFRQRLSR